MVVVVIIKVMVEVVGVIVGNASFMRRTRALRLELGLMGTGMDMGMGMGMGISMT